MKCSRCSSPAVTGRKVCERHRIEARDRERRRVEKLREAGLCIQCQSPAVAGMTRCEEHRVKARDRQRRVLAQRYESGLCHGCGKVPPADGYKRCMPCTIDLRERQRKWMSDPERAAEVKRKHRVRYASRQAAGLCGYCGAQPAPERLSCQRHIDQSRAYYKPKPRVKQDPELLRENKAERRRQRYWRRRSEGRCIRCGDPAVEGRSRCVAHLAYAAGWERNRQDSLRQSARSC